MSNPHKGDVDFVVDGKTYTLRYSHAALVKLEKQLDRSIVKIMNDLGNAEDMRISTVVAILWAGLSKHQPAMSLDDACELLDEFGNDAAIVELIGVAFQKAFNAPGTTGTNPTQRVGSGTGTNSSSNTSASVSTPTLSGISRPEN